jgi:chromosome segregation ATPase
LLEQKVQFLETTVESLKQKEKDYQNEIKSQKKELMTALKDSNAKYEEKMVSLNKKLDELQDEINDKDSKVSELEQSIYVINSSLSEKDVEVIALKTVADNIDLLREENDNLKNDLETNMKTFSSDYKVECDNLKSQVEELNSEINKKESELQSEGSRWEKEFTIQQQKIEFMETQVTEANHKIDENRKTHEAMLKAVQTRESEKVGVIEDADKKIENLKQEHYGEMKELETRFEATNKRLCDELDKVRKSESEATMKLKLTSTDNDKEISDLKSGLEGARSDRDRALGESKELEQQKHSLLQQTEDRYRQQIDSLERDLEDKKSKNQDELEEQQKKFEVDLGQLKNYYEQEKERLEKKVVDEKNKGERNVKTSIEDYEQRMQDEQNQHEDEMEMLQDDLRDKEDQLQAVTNKYEHELSLSDQKIHSLEDHLKETKKALDDIQEKNVTALDTQMNNFNKERKQHLDKTDELNHELTICEKKITTFENRTDSLNSEIKKKDEEIEQLRFDYVNKVKNVDLQIENLREEKQLLSDRIMHKNLENGREEALTKQQIEFLEHKNKELLQALSDSSTKYQEKLDSQKTETTQEVNDKIEKIIAEKEKIILKFDSKKKAYKELEKSSSVQVTKLERERAVNTERIENLEKKLNSEQEYSKKQIEAMREKISSLSDNSSKTVQEIEQKYFEMKQDYSELTKERADSLSTYEKNEALWKGQADFFKEQKEQLKNDLQESNRKLEAAIAQLQTKGSTANSDKKQIDIINKMEKDYKDQINKLQENHEKYVQDLMDKNKDLEAKNHSLQEKYELSYRDVNSSTKNLEKRMNEYEQRDSLQVEEIQKLKQERDRMLVDRQFAIDKEKEVYKAKINDVEKKFKISESDKGSLRFEIEKQQSKFNTEKDMLESNKSELHENIARLEKRNETLVAQNEKLKEKNKNSRKFSKYGGGANTSSYLDTSQGRFMTGKFLSVAKEVEADQFSNNSGKENRFKTFTKFIGDGGEGKEGEKTGSESGSGLEKTPEHYNKESDSTNTISPRGDKE